MNQWADTVSRELGLLISDNPPNIIYHYTDTKGLIGLVESGCIWATHVNRLNDSSENNHGFNLVTNYVRANEAKSSKPLFEKALLELQRVDTYVACYSTADDLLSQWRNYTGKQVGYSLGFETKKMVTLDEKMPLLESVIYKNKTSKEILDHFINSIEDFVSRNTFGEVEVGYLLGLIQATLNNIACIIKHPKFEEEREYRHFYQPKNNPLKLTPFFIPGKFGLTPYVKINFLEKKRLPLKTITVGPCQDFNIEYNALKVFLTKHGYENVEIIESSIPMRRS